MFRLSVCLIASLVYLQAIAYEKFEDENIASKYAEAVGSISIIENIFEAINTTCKTHFSIPEATLNEIDFLLRKKVLYSYAEFVNAFEDPQEVKKLATSTKNRLLQNIPNCSREQLEHLHSAYFKASIKKSLDTLRTEKRLYGLPKISRDNDDVIKIFIDKVQRYKTLPNEEITELAGALESGVYSYTIISLVKKITKDPSKALELRKFIAKNSEDPKYFYSLAKAQEKFDKKAALKSFKTSANLGYKYAEIWLGTYYACQNNKIDALFWLNKAKNKDPDHVNDIIVEIKELGMPTDCHQGWVY